MGQTFRQTSDRVRADWVATTPEHGQFYCIAVLRIQHSERDAKRWQRSYTADIQKNIQILTHPYLRVNKNKF